MILFFLLLTYRWLASRRVFLTVSLITSMSDVKRSPSSAKRMSVIPSPNAIQKNMRLLSHRPSTSKEGVHTSTTTTRKSKFSPHRPGTSLLPEEEGHTTASNKRGSKTIPHRPGTSLRDKEHTTTKKTRYPENDIKNRMKFHKESINRQLIDWDLSLDNSKDHNLTIHLNRNQPKGECGLCQMKFQYFPIDISLATIQRLRSIWFEDVTKSHDEDSPLYRWRKQAVGAPIRSISRMYSTFKICLYCR
jgi:hypothetical protein